MGKIESVSVMTKNNYKNLKEDIKALIKNMAELRSDWLIDHDKIISVEKDILSQQKELTSFKEQEKAYGMSTDKKLNKVEIALSKVSMSYGKVIGIAATSSALTGLVVAIVILVFKKIIIG